LYTVATLDHIHSALWVFSSHLAAYISCTLIRAVHYGIQWVHSIIFTMVSDYGLWFHVAVIY